MNAPRSELRACTVCETPFFSKRAANGRWRRTCGPFCQAEAIGRLIAALERRRDALLEEAEEA